MLVVLDTNALVPMFWPRSPSFQAVFAACRRLGVVLLIPEVVIDELEAKYREDARKAFSTVAKGQRMLKRLRIPGPSPEPRTCSEEALAATASAKYRRDLISELRSHGCQIRAYPTTSHKKVVARALRREPPFDGEGRAGYRDALIWETIRSAITERGEEVHFVTDDNDYRQGETLHPRLQAELDGLPALKLHRKLDLFSKAHIEPLLDERRLTLAGRFESDDEVGLRFRDQLLERIEEEVAESLFAATLGELESRAALEQVSWVDLLDARGLSDTSVLIRARAAVAVIVGGKEGVLVECWLSAVASPFDGGVSECEVERLKGPSCEISMTDLADFAECDLCGRLVHADDLAPFGAGGQESPYWCPACWKEADDEARAEWGSR